MSDVIITTKNGVDLMSKETLARWACLIEAIEVIDDTAKKNNIDLDESDWVKPIALQKYIKERYHAMLYDVEKILDLE